MNRFFEPGKLTIVMDGQFGSSGKGKIGAYLCERADNWQFAVNAFGAQAGHWVRFADGREFFYQTFNSCAHSPDRYEKLYVGPGAVIELPALLREIDENKIPSHKIGISPIANIIQQQDMDYEKGIVGFDGEERQHEGTQKSGSTCHGVGAATARKLLRRPDVRLARDLGVLKPFLCDVPNEIMDRLDKGQSGLMEIAQGFPLSLNHQLFYPHCTSRNVTVSAGLSDMFLPPSVAGQVVINLRTFPIRINSRKYIAKDDGRHLTWPEVQAGVAHTVYEGNSGHWYPDQKELSWDQLTQHSGSPTPIMEITSVTKLPRRVATFSRQNLSEVVRFNQTNSRVHLSLNFVNYVDYGMYGKTFTNEISEKLKGWIRENLGTFQDQVSFLGTGPNDEEMIYLEK